MTCSHQDIGTAGTQHLLSSSGLRYVWKAAPAAWCSAADCSWRCCRGCGWSCATLILINRCVPSEHPLHVCGASCGYLLSRLCRAPVLSHVSHEQWSCFSSPDTTLILPDAECSPAPGAAALRVPACLTACPAVLLRRCCWITLGSLSCGTRQQQQSCCGSVL